MDKKFKKICVLKGGDSPEREVSLSSSKCYSEALLSCGYKVCELDFTGDIHALILYLKKENPCCVLNGLHGGSGENGNVQSILNLLKIPYTHSGVLASSIAMDKHTSGKLFEKNGIRIPKTRLEKWNHFIKSPDFSCPFVIKPVDAGSSAGVYIIEDIAMLSEVNWIYGDKVLISEYIPGLELSVGVLDGKSLEVTNIKVQNGFYDYNNKYSVEGGDSAHEIPAKIPESIRKEAMTWAETAHSLIGCRGISRTDFRYNNITNELFALEINTQPGMTPTSLLPEQAKYNGTSFDSLVNWIVEQATYDVISA